MTTVPRVLSKRVLLVSGKHAPTVRPGSVSAAGRGERRLTWHQVRRASDATGVLSVIVVLLLLMPTRAGIPGLGAAGRPAFLLAGLGLLWWAVNRSVRPHVTRGRQPIRHLATVLLASALVGYAVGALRVLPINEARGGNRYVAAQLALLGIMLLAADGIDDRVRLQVLLRRLGMMAVFVALVGALQFFLRLDLNSRLILPGLTLNQPLLGNGSRIGSPVERVTGTTGHYIEFGVVLAMLVPILLHLAIYNRSSWGRLAWGASSLFVGGCALLSIARSALLALALVGVVLVLSWRPAAQARAALLGLVCVVLYSAAVPGVLGTFRSLVFAGERDNSIAGRTLDYPTVLAYVSERPWFGRGVGTFLPENYFFLDNQLLLTTLEGGLLGLAVLLGLYGTGYGLARSIRFGDGDDETRHLGQALATSVVIGFAVCATFDSLSFLDYAALLYLLIGMIGALWRLQHEPSPGRVLATPLLIPRTRRSRFRPTGSSTLGDLAPESGAKITNV